jgi:hypothetical protein
MEYVAVRKPRIAIDVKLACLRVVNFYFKLQYNELQLNFNSVAGSETQKCDSRGKYSRYIVAQS